MQCSAGRSYESALEFVLMEDTAYQEGDPIYEIDSVTFLQFVIDRVKAVDGSIYKVFLIVADVNGEILPIKCGECQ